MTKLLLKEILFIFYSQCINHFNELKKALKYSRILIYPNFDEPFVLTTDGSLFAIVTVLSQGSVGKYLSIASNKIL